MKRVERLRAPRRPARASRPAWAPDAERVGLRVTMRAGRVDDQRRRRRVRDADRAHVAVVDAAAGRAGRRPARAAGAPAPGARRACCGRAAGRPGPGRSWMIAPGTIDRAVAVERERRQRAQVELHRHEAAAAD